VGDVSRAGFAECMKVHDKLDILINCAGIVGPAGKKIADVSAADFDKV
jgi:NAD(P)-dependent dehydrogenase (short-subunit alcohol dehydrogenase family)